MNAVATALAALALLAAWTLLYLASERTRDALGSAAPRPARCRRWALLLITVAWIGCAWAQGPSMGSLLWVALLCALAHAPVALATWAPHWPAAWLGSGRGQRD